MARGEPLRVEGCSERPEEQFAGLDERRLTGAYFVVGLDAGSDESAPWAVVAARSASVALCARRRRPDLYVPPPARAVPAGAGRDRSVRHRSQRLRCYRDTKGAAGIVAVLSALYPIVTVVLARLVLAERLSVARRAGGVTALAGAAVAAAG